MPVISSRSGVLAVATAKAMNPEPPRDARTRSRKTEMLKSFLTAALLGLILPAQTQAGERPNIVFILADDLGCQRSMVSHHLQ